MQLIWEEFLNLIKADAGSQVVETWFKAVCLQNWDKENNIATLQMPNQFVKNWIQEHYLVLIKTHLSRLLHTTDIVLSLTCKNTTDAERTILPASVITQERSGISGTALVPHKKSLPEKTIQINKTNKISKLNSAYVFDSFVIGPTNSLAQAAAYAVSQNLGRVYNPLFIYGGTGLGKTHLLHSIGNKARRLNPKTVVRYETSDHFITEFITSIRCDKMMKFRERFQKVDLLLLDDIQFLSKKEQTQEAFFHIFNTLHQSNKQIVLSSDTFPKEIAGLQNRLRSRLEWGLVADIQMPDLETKIAILEKKAESQEITLPLEVAQFIAARILSNIRELEGALVRIGAFSALTNQTITLELAQRVLLYLPERKREGVELEKILNVVAKHYEVSPKDLKSKKRNKHIVNIRQVSLYLMKKLTFSSLQEIGESVGGRDHSTVIHAISKIESMIAEDMALNQKIKVIEQTIINS